MMMSIRAAIFRFDRDRKFPGIYRVLVHHRNRPARMTMQRRRTIKAMPRSPTSRFRTMDHHRVTLPKS